MFGLFRSLSICTLIMFTSACEQKAQVATPPPTTSAQPSAPTAAANTVVARVAGIEVTEKMLLNGIENSVYEAEKKIYEMKRVNLRNVMLDLVIADDLAKEGLKKDEYIAKHITHDIRITDEDINAFIAERKIASYRVDESIKKDIEQYLRFQKEDQAIDAFIQQQSGENPVEIYLTAPIEPVFEVDLSSSPTLGPETAPVTIIAYSDFQCPFCKKGAEVLDQTREKFGDQVRIIFKNFPLKMHADARIAAEAGVCAHRQSETLFWKMHDQMFSAQNKLTQPDLIASAELVGLDTAAFVECLEKGDVATKVDTDLTDGANAKIRSTPTFFINNERIDGLKQFDEFSVLIEQALAKVKNNDQESAE
jgi:protein-disulfide isomerase